MLLRRLLREDPGTEMEDIVRNLNYILKTKRGAGHFLDTFGLTDTGHRTAEEMIVRLTDELTQNVTLYEPRVEIVDIDEDYDEDTNRVRLTVACRAKESGDMVLIALDPSGQMIDVTTRLRTAGGDDD